MYDLIIFGGQSNMQGQTEGNPNDMPVANAKEYLLLSDSFKELKNPVGEDIGELLLASHMGGGSLVPYFAQEYVKGTGRSVVAVHAAKGATTIKQWLKNTAEGGERYKKAVENYESRFGALHVDCVNTKGNSWEWNNSPWPWEVR